MAHMFRALRVSLNHRPPGRCVRDGWLWPQYIEF